MSIVAIWIDFEARVKADDDGRRQNIRSLQLKTLFTRELPYHEQ